MLCILRFQQPGKTTFATPQIQKSITVKEEKGPAQSRLVRTEKVWEMRVAQTEELTLCQPLQVTRQQAN